MQVPIDVKVTTKCQRCGLRYPKEQEACIHCAGLTDQAVKALKAQHKREQAGNANLGRLFLYIAALVVVGMLIAALK